MATYTLKEIVGLFKSGKSLDGIVALEAYEASVSAGRLRGAKKKSEARSNAARENGKLGGRPKQGRGLESYRHIDNGPDQSIIGRGPDLVPLAEENHGGSGGAAPITMPGRWAHLPPGVMKGSEMEGRG